MEKSWKYYPFLSPIKKKRKKKIASGEDFGHADLASETLKEKQKFNAG